MKGLTENTSEILKKLADKNFLEGYTFIGGSALSVQIGHRLSEDLDFCKWKSQNDKNPAVDWKTIENHLSHFGIKNTNLLGFNQVDFFLNNGVRIGFYANNLYNSPVKNINHIKGKIYAADLESIGIMKIELMLRRSNFRDYYDLYSILQEGVSLKSLVSGAGVYSKHRLSAKNILSFITNCDNYRKEKEFEQLNPKYRVESKDIESFIKETVELEYSIKRENG